MPGYRRGHRFSSIFVLLLTIMRYGHVTAHVYMFQGVELISLKICPSPRVMRRDV